MTTRAEIYDQMAPKYDARYLDEKSREENESVAGIVRELHPDPYLLDVGCGTGLALELELAKQSKYTGLDPSQGMLAEFRRKFSGLLPSQIRPITFEDAVASGWLAKQEFDVAISLFGSPSYIDPEHMRCLVDLAPHGVVMHYLPGYWPDFEPEIETAPESLRIAQYEVEIRGGVVFELNNFQVGVW